MIQFLIELPNDILLFCNLLQNAGLAVGYATFAAMSHRAGFVSVVGMPNAGKSSLINALTESDLSIVTARPQTTRTKLISIWNTESHQLILCDTPGYIEQESYLLHRYMNKVVSEAFTDADAILLVLDARLGLKLPEAFSKPLQSNSLPLFVFLNKSDQVKPEQMLELLSQTQVALPSAKLYPGSALKNEGVVALRKALENVLPESPAFYDKEDLSDRHLRFFVGEIIRASIFELFSQEIPYHSEVVVEDYKESEKLDRISCYIITERESQKIILIGSKGSAIRELGIRSRKKLEDFLGKKVHLDLTVKTAGDWRNDPLQLKQFGYNL
jgi:GTP-binding protein Era